MESFFLYHPRTVTLHSIEFEINILCSELEVFKRNKFILLLSTLCRMDLVESHSTRFLKAALLDQFCSCNLCISFLNMCTGSRFVIEIKILLVEITTVTSIFWQTLSRAAMARTLCLTMSNFTDVCEFPVLYSVSACAQIGVRTAHGGSGSGKGWGHACRRHLSAPCPSPGLRVRCGGRRAYAAKAERTQ